MKERVARLKEESARIFIKWAAQLLAKELYLEILGHEPEAVEPATSTGSPSSTQLQDKQFHLDAAELVTIAYKGLLNREADADGLALHSARLMRDGNIPSFLDAIVRGKEFKKKRIVVGEYLAPLWSEQIKKVSTEATPEQFELLFERIRGEWTALGDTEPHWSVHVSERYKSKTFAEHEEEFYESGHNSISVIRRLTELAGLEISPEATVLELGCGTGRVTHVLADRYARVIAVDVSPGNLRLCQEKMTQLGKTNVDFFLLKSPRDIQDIPPVDFFFSTIVLQHNPPPVIHYFLDQIFGKIRKSGSVIFQVPTHHAGYTFNVTEYLSSRPPVMEMHILPMQAVFSLFAKHGLTPVEVLMDGCTNWLGSHTFFAVRQ
jgi:SAM-dependent methyltransferase